MSPFRFACFCSKVAKLQGSARAITATRLWNLADRRENIEYLLTILRCAVPDMFIGPSLNDFAFTYPEYLNN